MKIIIISLFFLVAHCSTIFAQPKYFEKNEGWLDVHEGRRIMQKSDDNYLIMGNILSYISPFWKAYTTVVDNKGILQAPIEYSLPDSYSGGGYDMISTNYGYAFCGFSESSFDLTQSYLVRTNHEGELIDTLLVGSSVYPNVSHSLCRTPDNGYLLAGSITIIDNNANFSYPYLLRLDANFNTLWDTTYQLPGFAGYHSGFEKIIPNYADNSYYLVGNINNFASVNDVLWLHIDSLGHILHQRIITEPEYFSEETILDFIQTLDGDFVLGITKRHTTVAKAGVILKLSPTGDTIRWIKKVFDLGVVSKIYQLPDSSYIVAGGTIPSTEQTFDANIAHVSASGDSILWQRRYGGSLSDYIFDFIPTSDGSYFFVGRTESPDLGVPAGGANVYLLKTNCMGLLTQPEASFNTQIDTAALTATFQNLSQYIYPDSIDGGHYLWQFGDGATSTEQNPTHTYAQGGNYTVTLTAVVCSDTSVFVQTVSTWAVGNELVSANNLVKVFPNPANSYLTVVTTNATQGGNLVLYDMLGRAVKQVTLSNTNTSINVSDLCAGVYLYEIFNSYSSSIQKVTYGKVNVLH